MNKDLKRLAIGMRMKGQSYPEIEKAIKVSKSTLSGWLSNLTLPSSAQKKIQDRKIKHTKEAQKLAAISHREKNLAERALIKSQVRTNLENEKISVVTQEMLLAMLYLGEGFKKRSFIALGNSNPEILKIFVNLVRNIYNAPPEKFSCALYLRSDQGELEEKKFWSKQLKINTGRFQKTQFDKRTLGIKTRQGYHGVCAVYYFSAIAEKRLTAWQDLLIEKLLGG